MNLNQILKKFESLKNPENVAGMERFGINPNKTFGIKIPVLRQMAREIGTDHKLARGLWNSGYHEARILASMVADVKQADEKMMDSWIKDFDSWDICDQVMLNLFWSSPIAYKKTIEWASRKEEFEKRAGFALMACLAFKDKEASDNKFEPFFPAIKREAKDARNYVKKAVNWALRQIGKRNLTLNKKMIKLGKEIQKIDSRSAKWVASDALRELMSETVQNRLKS